MDDLQIDTHVDMIKININTRVQSAMLIVVGDDHLLKRDGHMSVMHSTIGLVT